MLSRRSLLLLAGSAVACAPATLPPSSPSQLLGAPLPPFSGTTLNGSDFDSNQSRGNVLAISFFETTCTACDGELEATGALYSDHPELVLVGVSLDDSIEIARAEVRRHSLRFPILFDSERRVAQRLGVEGPRTVLVVDRRGILRWVGNHPSANAVRDAAEALLDESA
jgi:peroxiredoxin